MGTAEPTLYEILGVAKDASVGEIKAAHRQRARKLHPDAAGPEMKGLYLHVQRAYEILSDPGRRAEYDRSLRGGAGSESSGSAPRPRAEEPPPRPPKDWVAGEQVPRELYGGPLPREGHDLGRMPWIDEFDGVERSSVRLERVGLRRRHLAVIAGASALALMGLAQIAPATLVPAGIGIVGAMLIWWSGRIPRKTAALLLLAFGAFAGLEILEVAQRGGPWGGLLAAVLGSLVVVGVLWWAVVKLVADRRRGATRRVPPKDAVEAFSWGEAGDALAAAQERSGVGHTMDGVEGERLTAAEVGYFLGSIPGLRLINGLAFPGSSRADVDHAVLCGNRVALVDSKAWRPATYTKVGGQDAIRVGRGESWDYFPMHMSEAVEGYRAILAAKGLREVEVRGYVVIHPKNLTEPLEVGNDSPTDPVQLVTSPELITSLGAWLGGDPEQARTVNYRLLNLLVQNIQ